MGIVKKLYYKLSVTAIENGRLYEVRSYTVVVVAVALPPALQTSSNL